MSKVFVLDTHKQPLNPMHPGKARLLLTQGKAAVLKRYPFTIILKTAIEMPEVTPLRVKIDPGSKTTGLAIVNDVSGEVVFAAELSHRGAYIKERLEKRRAVRRSRRHHRLKALGLPVEVGSGGLTKFNRTTRGLDKEHWLDATCIGKSTPERIHIVGVIPLLITANGHGCRQMCRMYDNGFPRTKPKQAKVVKGFQTGDMVKAIVITGAKVGTYVGRVAIRATGSFNITTKQGTVQGISHRFCTSLHCVDGYSYQKGACHSSPV